MPHPAILFLVLCVVVIVLSQVLYWFDVKATYEVVKPPPVPTEETYYGGSSEPIDVGADRARAARGLPASRPRRRRSRACSPARACATSSRRSSRNFRNFAAVAIILVVMIGVGLAEAAGLIASLIRKLVGVSSRGTLTFIIVLLGMLSSVASDAGYLVLIPLGAAAFKSVGRNPLAGIAAAFAGVAAGFGVNVLITPLDGVLTEITNDVDRARRPEPHIDLAANLYFGIGSTIFVTFVLTFLTARLVETRLGPGTRRTHGEGWAMDDEDAGGLAGGRRAAACARAARATLAVLVVDHAADGDPGRAAPESR